MKGFKTFCCIVAVTAVAASALMGCSDMGSGPSPDIAPHLISQPEAMPVRPIAEFDTAPMSPVSGTLSDAEYRARVSELYHTVAELHKKPVFVMNDPVEPVYRAAIEILDKYILNSWHTDPDGEFRKVHTIHDYLVADVDYDFELYEKYQNNEDVDDHSSFDIDGALLHKLAVCDGLSRTANFLCAIEGIDCVQVTGTYQAIPHAWNRVKVDGKWYNMDITADAANYTVKNDGSHSKQLSHGFFLLSDSTFRMFSTTGSHGGAHIFNINPQKPIVADTDYNYFGNNGVVIGDETFSRTVTSKEQLNEMFTKIGASGRTVGKIEIRLDFPGKTNVNDGDIYYEYIKEAYSCVKNADFRFKDDQRPYFRYPNGVYLCLIYK